MYALSFKLSFVILLAVLSIVPFSVHSAPLYTVSPLVFDTKAEPRDILTKKITITNPGQQPVTLFPTVNNISLKDGETIEEFVQQVVSDQTTSLSAWIEISRAGLDLKQGESKTIDVTLRINPQAKPGTYHAFIGFGNGGNRDEAERQVKNGQAPGTVVTVTIEEKKSELMKLSKFIVDKFVTQAENQAAVYTFRNPGDEPLIPHGEIILFDSTGAEIGTVPVNAEGVTILPGQEHSFTATLPTEGLFGKYKAFLSVEYGSKQRGSMQDTNFFYVFPLKSLLVILSICMLFVAMLAWYLHRRYLDVDLDDSDSLVFHVRESVSDAKEHDVNLKQK